MRVAHGTVGKGHGILLHPGLLFTTSSDLRQAPLPPKVKSEQMGDFRSPCQLGQAGFQLLRWMGQSFS